MRNPDADILLISCLPVSDRPEVISHDADEKRPPEFRPSLTIAVDADTKSKEARWLSHDGTF
jgi:hypothetical protein